MTQSLKSKLTNRDLTVGSWSMLGDPAIAEIMIKAGFDWVVIDLEHTAIGIGKVEEAIRAIQGAGADALVRLTSNNPDQIKRVMDSGAAGVLVPMVGSAEEAKQAVSSIYYPPKGKRGVALTRASGYGADFEEYQKWLADEAVCIVQIEHIDAVKSCRDILSVDGVDGYMIGPYDLSASMGLIGQIDHPDVLAAIETVRKTAEELGKATGIHLVAPDENQLKALISEGFTFIAYSIDTRILDVTSRKAVKAAKEG